MTNETPDTAVVQDRQVAEPFDFSSRLLLTYILAGVVFVSADKSLYILAVAFVAWAIFTVRLFLRFRARAAWSLLGAPFALYWLLLIFGQSNSDVILV